MNTDLTAFDPRALRQVLGSFVTGVTIITTVDPQGRRAGLTANSSARCPSSRHWCCGASRLLLPATAPSSATRSVLRSASSPRIRSSSRTGSAVAEQTSSRGWRSGKGSAASRSSKVRQPTWSVFANAAILAVTMPSFSAEWNGSSAMGADPLYSAVDAISSLRPMTSVSSRSKSACRIFRPSARRTLCDHLPSLARGRIAAHDRCGRMGQSRPDHRSVGRIVASCE